MDRCDLSGPQRIYVSLPSPFLGSRYTKAFVYHPQRRARSRALTHVHDTQTTIARCLRSGTSSSFPFGPGLGDHLLWLLRGEPA